MQTMLWNAPFLPLGAVRQDFLDGLARANGVNGESEMRRIEAMPAGVYANDDSFVLAVDLPGCGEDDVDVTFEKGVLRIQATRKQPEDLGECRLDEHAYGVAERQFRLGDEVDPDAIEATLENGVLTVRLGRSTEARSRKVAVRAIA